MQEYKQIDIFEEISDDKTSIDTYKEKIESLVMLCHGIAKESGWWDSTTERDIPRLLMLCVSELSEAMEGDRKNLMDEHLPHRKMFEVELADAVIRIFDMAGGLDLDLGGALVEKLIYNRQRQDHKRENRDKDNGKKY